MPDIDMSRTAKLCVASPKRMSARSSAVTRSAARRRGSSMQTMQAMVRMTMLYQLQNRHSALESQHLRCPGG
jgi:hypothetical protein